MMLMTTKKAVETGVFQADFVPYPVITGESQDFTLN
jgi:hypothetical protein